MSELAEDDLRRRSRPDYRNALPVLLIAALLVNLVAGIARSAPAAPPRFEEFASLLAVSSAIAFAGSLLLRINAGWLGRMTPLSGMFAALLILLAATLFVVGMLYLVLDQFGLRGDVDNLAALKAVTVGVIVYPPVLWVLWLQAREREAGNSARNARLQALQSRIRPHFMFNSMNSIAGLIRSNPGQAEHVLTELADLFRVLMADARKLVTLAAEIETTKQYLAVEQLRLGERLAVNWRIDKLPPRCLIPSLTLQPLIENAVYHGIEPSFGGGLIDIHIWADAKQRELYIMIRNPVPDSGADKHERGNQIAMQNIRERLQRHFGDRASLKLYRRDEIFATKLGIPIQQAAEPA